MKKISVIMAVYNTKPFLEEAINSILTQSFKDFEFIILDDFSTDGSYEYLQDCQKLDERIQLYRNDKNMGISFTRNKLIGLTNTNYIATQDSDDISEPNRLELCYNFLENNTDYGVVSGNNIIINEKSKIIGYRKYSDNIKKVILKKSPISQPSSMFRKDIYLDVGGYDKYLNFGEDYDLWLRIFLIGYKIKNLSQNLIKYRIREGQTKSSSLKQTIKNTILIQKKAIKLGIKPSYSDLFYIFLEYLLLLLPSKIILFLFKKLEYKNAK